MIEKATIEPAILRGLSFSVQKYIAIADPAWGGQFVKRRWTMHKQGGVLSEPVRKP
jgi:hypothetical protein